MRLAKFLQKAALAAAFTVTALVPASGTLLGSGLPSFAASTATGTTGHSSLLVAGDPAAVERSVRALGGTVDFRLGADAFAVQLPSGNLEALRAAAGIRHVELDAPLVLATRGDDDRVTRQVWQQAIDLRRVQARGVDGRGVTIAVLDTGIARSVEGEFRDTPLNRGTDRYGHGTHVAGIAAGKEISNRDSTGVAPGARVLNVPAGGSDGVARASDLVRGIDWVVANRKAYNIGVLNISASTSSTGSYLTGFINAAVERAWFSGIVVVVSAGNNGPGAVNSAPANDPFVITVGAYDDKGTTSTLDDSLAPWSAEGVTRDGVAKPDVVAPGRHIISLLARGNPVLAQQNPKLVVDGFLNLSGTSMSAPQVAGLAALVLQENPRLKPDEVKARIVAAATPLEGSRAPRVDAYDAVFGPPAGKANRHQPINLILANAAGLIKLEQAPWNSVPWDSITWGSVTWDSITWDSITWDSVTWDSITWDSVTWDSVTWDSITWDSITWDATTTGRDN